MIKDDIRPRLVVSLAVTDPHALKVSRHRLSFADALSEGNVPSGQSTKQFMQ